MHKRLISFFLAFSLLLSLFSFGVFADDTHQHTFENKREYDLTNLPSGYQIPFTVYEAPCSGGCGYSEYSWNVFGISGKFVDKTGTPALTVYKHYREWFEGTYGKNATATKVPTGIGRKDLPGYASDDGTPSVSSRGGIIWQTTFDDNTKDYISTSFYKYDRWNPGTIEFDFSKIRENPNYYKPWFITFNSTDFIIEYSSSSNYTSYYVSGDSSSSDKAGFVFTAPIKGYYRLLAGKRGYYENAEITNYYTEGNKSYLYDVGADITISNVVQFNYYFSSDSGFTSKHHIWHFYLPKYEIIPYSAADKPTSQTNITINNNTWTGNIYTDNSTNLTYIYPQYTTINENNETVTNISENPIIYNSETKQYYTYDSVTNNYYYITYEAPATPTPSPSPSPSPAPTETPSPSESPAPTPTPDPGENPTPTPTPGGGTVITPGGGGSGSGSSSGSSSGISGGNDEGLFGWLWDLLKDLVKAILKAIFKVLSGLLGFLIWLVERVGILLPFLPTPAIAALGAGVVLVFVIRIIRFIRG